MFLPPNLKFQMLGEFDVKSFRCSAMFDGVYCAIFFRLVEWISR